jgi:hypothetical protein
MSHILNIDEMDAIALQNAARRAEAAHVMDEALLLDKLARKAAAVLTNARDFRDRYARFPPAKPRTWRDMPTTLKHEPRVDR